jgi:hypothetical protein
VAGFGAFSRLRVDEIDRVNGETLAEIEGGWIEGETGGMCPEI